MSEATENHSPSQGSQQRYGGLARSVLSNWVWYFLVLVSGFILPRIIDRNQGQDLLGVWDLSWSLVSYISLLSLSITAAVNRYVARYRTAQDWRALNEAFNSCLALLAAGTLLGFIAALLCYALVPYMLPEASTADIATGQWVVLILSASVALQILGGAFNGVITGYERFDLLNLIRGTRDLLILLGMIGLLLSGYGLLGIACASLGGDLLGELGKFVIAKRICPQLQVSPALCSRTIAKDMLGFGGKAAMQNLSQAALYQANSILVAYFLGLGALAVFARQRALVMHMMRFIKQYAQVFIPRSSSLDAHEDIEGLRHLAIQASKFGLYVTMPITLTLLILGGALLNVWMGAAYEAPLVLAILAVGHLVTGPQLSTYMVLMGMGRHGRPALYELGGAILSVALGLLILGVFHGGMVGAALAMSVPILITSCVLVPLYACRVLEMNFWRYVREVVSGPILASIPFGSCLLLARFFFAASPGQALAVGLGSGGVITIALYWRWVLPESLKSRILQTAGLRRIKSAL